MQEWENQYSVLRERESASSGCGTQDVYSLLAETSFPWLLSHRACLCLGAVLRLDLSLAELSIELQSPQQLCGWAFDF